MFKLKTIEVDGFWQTKKASTSVREDVNIIIGRNGTGKTTFMNIIHAVLAVDLDVLYDNAFKSVTLSLTDGKRTRTIRADRIEHESSSFAVIEYHISNRRFTVPLLGGEDGRNMSMLARRRATEEAQKIKRELSALVSVASLSVYRIGSEPDPELRERMPRRNISTVDLRLVNLMQRLTQYQLELSNGAREVSSELQRDVLTSLLYTEETKIDRGYSLNFDEAIERRNLVSAYRQLGVGGSDIAKKIQDHLAAVGKTVRMLREISEKRNSDSQKSSTQSLPVDFAALEAFN